MGEDSAPGPDGFNGCFFQHFWDVVGDSVYHSMLKFFKIGWILPSLNSNLVVLIPKVPKADTINNFRPITLANFQFKVITKFLVERWVSIAPKIFSL